MVPIDGRFPEYGELYSAELEMVDPIGVLETEVSFQRSANNPT